MKIRLPVSAGLANLARSLAWKQHGLLQRFRRSLVPALFILVSACGGGGGGSGGGSGAPTLASISVAPVNASISVGFTRLFTALGLYTDGSTANITSSVTWTSSTPAVATINTTGLATGVTTGTTTITAASGTISGSATLMVAGGGTTTYTIGGTVTGLSGTVVLRNNGGDNLSRSTIGGFTFATALATSSAYSVTVFSQPNGQTCTVTNGSGTVNGANVTNVQVNCVTNPGPPPPLTPPSVTTQPSVQTVAVGASATFTVVAAGSPTPAYQWQVSNDRGVTFANISGATSSNYAMPPTLLADSGKRFRVVLSNTVGSVISQSAPLVVGVPAVSGPNVLYAVSQTGNPKVSLLDGSLSVFSVDAATGAVSPVVGGTVQTGRLPGPIHFSADGRFGYVRNALGDSISAYRIDAATRLPVPVSGSPFQVGAFQILGSLPPRVHLHPNGNFLYVIATPAQGSNVIRGYTIDSSTGALSLLPTVPVTPGLSSLGDILFVAGGACAVVMSGGNSVYPLAVNTTTGALTAVTAAPITAASDYVNNVVDSSGRFIYSAARNSLVGWSVSPTTCELTPIAGSPLIVTDNMEALAFDAARRYLYVTNSSSSRAISGYHSDPNTGALTPLTGSPFSLGFNGTGLFGFELRAELVAPVHDRCRSRDGIFARRQQWFACGTARKPVRSIHLTLAEYAFSHHSRPKREYALFDCAHGRNLGTSDRFQRRGVGNW